MACFRRAAVPERAAPPSLAGSAAVVFLTDPDHAPETPAQLLRRVYGLTRKEAQLALALAGGANLADAAERLRIAKGTARRHLAAIFARTGIHRQAELVRLILSLPPSQRPNRPTRAGPPSNRADAPAIFHVIESAAEFPVPASFGAFLRSSPERPKPA